MQHSVFSPFGGLTFRWYVEILRVHRLSNVEEIHDYRGSHVVPINDDVAYRIAVFQTEYAVIFCT